VFYALIGAIDTLCCWDFNFKLFVETTFDLNGKRLDAFKIPFQCGQVKIKANRCTGNS